MESGTVRSPTAPQYFVNPQQPTRRNCCTTIEQATQAVAKQAQTLNTLAQSLSIRLDQLIERTKAMSAETQEQLDDVDRLCRRHQQRIDHNRAKEALIASLAKAIESSKVSSPPFGMYL